jgi:polar amino acid transport system permease protein
VAEAEAVTETERPPDTRGAPSPFSTVVYWTGVASFIVAAVGTLVLQLIQAQFGNSVTQECQGAGIRADLRGGLGVCNIVEAFRSRPQTIVLILAIALGAIVIVLGFSTFRRMPTKRQREQAVSGAFWGVHAITLAAFLFWFRGGDVETFARNFLNFEVLGGYGDDFLNGAKNTVVLAFLGELGGIIIGLTLAVLTLSPRPVVRGPARAYINFFRGTPLLWQLSIFYFGFALGLQISVSAYQTAIIVFGLNTGAYAAEVFRAGIQSIERGQIEAARSLGMTYMQSMRYAILPQAVRRVIPPLMNEFVILIKDTSLIAFLGLISSEREIFSVGREGYAETFNATFFVATAAGYLAVTLPLIRVVNAVEHRLRSGLLGVTHL